MKICRNNFDICLCNLDYCFNCSFLIGNECKWLRTIGKSILECGGIMSHDLSDIFTL